MPTVLVVSSVELDEDVSRYLKGMPFLVMKFLPNTGMAWNSWFVINDRSLNQSSPVAKCLADRTKIEFRLEDDEVTRERPQLAEWSAALGPDLSVKTIATSFFEEESVYTVRILQHFAFHVSLAGRALVINPSGQPLEIAKKRPFVRQWVDQPTA